MKRKKSNLDKWIHLRVSQEEVSRLREHFKKTTYRKMSDYLRGQLFRKPPTVFYRNKTADEFLGVALQLKSELNAIGNNLNQTVKKLHIFHGQEELSATLFALDINTRILVYEIEKIKEKMHGIYVLLNTETPPPEAGNSGTDNQAAAADERKEKSGQQ